MPAVHFHDVLDDAQPQSGTANIAHATGVVLGEFLENPFAEIIWHTGAMIPD